MANIYTANILRLFLVGVVFFAIWFPTHKVGDKSTVVSPIEKSIVIPRIITTIDCANQFVSIVIDTPFIENSSCHILHFKSTETNSRYEVTEIQASEQIDIQLVGTSQSIFIVAIDSIGTKHFSQTHNIFCPKIISKKASPLKKMRRHQKPNL
jgi:hypothetical protein